MTSVRASHDVSNGGRGLLPGIGFALLSASGFGTMAIVAKLAYERGGEPLSLLATRFTVAVVLLALLNRTAGYKTQAPAGLRLRLLILGGTALGAETCLFYSALKIAPAGIVSLVFYSFPLVTAVIAVALRLEPARPRTFIALTLGSAGLALILGIGGSHVGLLLALGGAVLVAIYFILAGILIQGVSSSIAAAWTLTGAAISVSAAALVSGQTLPASALPAGITLGLLTTAGFVALYAAIARIGASRAAVALMFEPIVTVALAAIFLGERITGRLALGAVLIFASLPVLSARGRHRPAPPAPDSL